MDGITFEKFCMTYLSRNGYRRITQTKASHDQGIDIIAYRHGLKYGFQCKYYSQPVSNKAVQEAYTGGAYYGCDRYGVITNTTFTTSAIELSEELDVILLDHITPDKQSPLFLRFRIHTFLPIIIGVYQLFQYDQSTRSIYILQAVSLITSGLFGMMYTRIASLLTLFSVILFFLCDITIHGFSLTSSYRLLWIYLILYLIGYAILFHHKTVAYMKHDAMENRSLLHEDMNDTLNDLKKILEDLLQEEFQKNITCVSATHTDKGHDTFTFKSTQNISADLPLVEYSVNQAARHNHTNDHYSFQQLNTKEFILTITKESDKNS